MLAHMCAYPLSVRLCECKWDVRVWRRVRFTAECTRRVFGILSPTGLPRHAICFAVCVTCERNERVVGSTTPRGWSEIRTVHYRVSRLMKTLRKTPICIESFLNDDQN